MRINDEHNEKLLSLTMFDKETRVQDSGTEIIQELRPMAVVSLRFFMGIHSQKSRYSRISWRSGKWTVKAAIGRVKFVCCSTEVSLSPEKNTQPMNGSGRWCLRGSISQGVGERWVSCWMGEWWSFLNESLELSALKGVIGISVSTGVFLMYLLLYPSRSTPGSQDYRKDHIHCRWEAPSRTVSRNCSLCIAPYQEGFQIFPGAEWTRHY